MIHIDAKKLGKIRGIAHRIHGNRKCRARGVGWEVAFVAVDDHTRLAYSEVLPRENAATPRHFYGVPCGASNAWELLWVG
jgi:hypothetical protein